MTLTANARPTKQFFITNLTRDLSLEDAILDLVDNSIDAYVRMKGLDVSANLLRAPSNAALKMVSPERATVRLTVGETYFEIVDHAGGIDLEHARKSVFRLGRADPGPPTLLGVYGIGLKRAIFKLGNRIEIESRTTENGFRLRLDDVKKWASDDRPETWTFPLTRLEKAKTSRSAGTRIRVEELSQEVLLRLRNPQLLKRLREHISTTYTLFLDRFLTISLNGVLVTPTLLPIGVSEEVIPAAKELEFAGVKVELIAGLAARKRQAWKAESAGWYVLCNGRVVVSADKTDLTGWGINSARYVSKYRGFVGIAFFFSADPAALPWTTTKRGLNQDSEVYQLARVEMTVVARPVLSFLNDMYPSEPAEVITERRLADELRATDVRALVDKDRPVFSIPARVKQKKKNTVKVQYDADMSEVERVQKKLNKPSWSVGDVGRHTFEYFLKMECPE